jgi:hypothetical protein
MPKSKDERQQTKRCNDALRLSGMSLAPRSAHPFPHGDIMKALIAAIVVSLLAVAPVSAQTTAPDSTTADQATTPKVKKAKKKVRRTASKAKAKAKDINSSATAGTAANAEGERYREGVTAK